MIAALTLAHLDSPSKWQGQSGSESRRRGKDESGFDHGSGARLWACPSRRLVARQLEAALLEANKLLEGDAQEKAAALAESNAPL